MKTSLIVILVGFFLSVSWVGYLGFGWFSFNAGNEMMVDGITISAVIVTVLSVVFSILSWFLFSWATKSINFKGIMISVITGVVLITPFTGVLGPMAAVLIGLVAGFAAYMIQKKIHFATNKPLIIGVSMIAASYVILFAIVVSVQPITHIWDAGSGVGAWTESNKTPIEKLLVQNQIAYDPDTLAVAGGITFGGGDPGCGAVVDHDSDVHWFHVDSISNPTNMTLYDDNPMPCKINHGSCFCNAQTAFVEVMTSELSYLTPTEEEQIGQRVKERFETIPHQIPVTKFVVGKYNLDLGERYDEICGVLLTRGDREDRFNEEYSIYKYFSAAKEGIRLWDFSLSVGSEKLCAISDNAKIFEYEKQSE